MIDIASSLFQIERRVNQKKDDAWMEEAQNLLNQLARSEHEKSNITPLSGLLEMEQRTCQISRSWKMAVSVI